MSLRRSFICAVIVTMLAVLAASSITIFAGLTFQKWLLPETDSLFLHFDVMYTDDSENQFSVRMKPGDDVLKLERSGEDLDISKLMDEDPESIVRLRTLAKTEIGGSDTQDTQEIEKIDVSVERIETSYTSLTPRRKMAYMGASAAMILLPVFYSLTGILLCAFHFYKKKLQPPIQILSDATEHIGKKDLDFEVSYDSRDEMGALCASFETMRQELVKNNRELWEILEARKELQASVAHDLRNPIAIIQGYAEYLQIHIAGETLNKEQVAKTASNLEHAARRLEQYTNSIRDINHLEELKLHRTECALPDLLLEMADDFRLLARQRNILLDVACTCPQRSAKVDSQVLYRILENVVTNALRFAKERIEICFDMKDAQLNIVISDDGGGFPENVIRKQKGVLTLGVGEHMGMGLNVCQVLCRKHGGYLRLSNRVPQGGARVEISIKVE